MNVYIALLRGVNVGGHNKVPMADLRRMFETMGFAHVQTYIQSGNVLFVADEPKETLRMRIEQEIERHFGFGILVVLRTKEEWMQLIERCPYRVDDERIAPTAEGAERLYVSSFLTELSTTMTESFDVYCVDGDEYHVAGQDIYFRFEHGIRNSKLANRLSRLDVPSTSRNWKTVLKLGGLADRLSV